MKSRWDTVQVDGNPMRVYSAVPDAPGPHPGVVVIQHASGVDVFTQTMVDRLTHEGYAAAAPDLYHRQDDNILKEVANLPPEQRMAKIRTKMERFRDPEITADVTAAAEYLRGHVDAKAGPIGITGFCMGGRVTYLAAATVPGLAAAAVFYGGTMLKPWGDGPSPFDLTANIACPLIGFFGGDDTNPSPDDVQKISAELDKHGKSHTFHSYPGAGHAFQNFENPTSYRKEASQDSWEKLLAFFQEHLKARVVAAAGE